MKPNHRAATVATLLEAGEVERFHAVPAIPAQTVAAHSWGVAIIALQILGADYPRLGIAITGCLLHDTGELITGDIPFTAKRGVFADVKPQLDAAEARAMAENLWPQVEMSPMEETVLKLADMLEGLRWANLYERTASGHMPIIPDRWWHALNDMFCSEQCLLLPSEMAERAYSVFGVLSPAYYAHRVYSSYKALKDSKYEELSLFFTAHDQ